MMNCFLRDEFFNIVVSDGNFGLLLLKVFKDGKLNEDYFSKKSVKHKISEVYADLNGELWLCDQSKSIFKLEFFK